MYNHSKIITLPLPHLISYSISLPPTVGGICFSTDCVPPGGHRRPYCHRRSTPSCAVYRLRSSPPSSSTPFAGNFYWKSWSCSLESRIIATTEKERRGISSLACAPKPLRYGCLTRSQCTLVKLLDKPTYARTIQLRKLLLRASLGTRKWLGTFFSILSLEKDLDL